jgi:hypothetical protein
MFVHRQRRELNGTVLALAAMLLSAELSIRCELLR